MCILIVGAGITGALIGYFLRQWNSNVNLHLWEAEDQPGGRMAISEYDLNLFADIGLQYISTDNLKEDYYKHIYDVLQNNNLLEPLKCKILNSNRYASNSDYFVAPNGARSIVEYFINEAKFNDIQYNKKVTHVDIETIDEIVTVRTQSNKIYNYSIVILTAPLPQILNEINGNYRQLIENKTELYNELQNVRYGCKYALVEFFDKPLVTDWGAQFIKGDDVFRYMAIDNVKRNRPSSKSAIIYHTEDAFAQKHTNDSIQNIKSILKERAHKLFPDWNNSICTKLHKWPYATVRAKAKLNKPFVNLSLKPMVLISGDSFTGSKFDNNILTAKETASFLAANIVNVTKFIR